ncbi:MAG: TIGR02452 family protein [Acutalibacteraceae bacterium]
MRFDNVLILEDTLKIFEQGYYNKQGKSIKLKLSKEQQTEVQVFLPEDIEKVIAYDGLEKIYCPGWCSHSCENMDSFSMARKISNTYINNLNNEKNQRVLVLNLADPIYPGGGVRRGSRAQEEDLCRKSSLLLSLESQEAWKYYAYNRTLHTYMGSDAMIFTPNVEIIKDENGELLDETVIVSVVTCAAPMIKFGKEGMTEEEYRKMVYNRITGMLKCSAYLGYEYLVLGAWGCGAFRNDAKVISDLFYKALKELDYNGLKEQDLFKRVDFAVLDKTESQYNYKEFCRNFVQDNFYRDQYERDRNIVEAKIKEKSQYLDKVRGSLFGGAVGDALGYPIEFDKEDEIFAKFGKNGITDYVLDPSTGKALISDDTQMTLFTANGILFKDTELSLKGICREARYGVQYAYFDWLVTQIYSFEDSRKIKKQVSWLYDVPELYSARAPGNTCISALIHRVKSDDNIDSFIESKINESKGCGGVMRVAPMGLIYTYGNIEDIDMEAAEIAAITHSHPLGYMTAAVLAHIIHVIVFSKENLSLKELVEQARDTVRKIYKSEQYINDFTDIIDLAIELSENDDTDLNNIHRLGEGWVAEETLAIAIYCSLRHQNDFSAGIIAAVNHNGDSDSTGAITGNILGALLGYNAIEEKWKENLELSNIILEMADDLCFGCPLSEFSIYKDADWKRRYIDLLPK